MDPCQPVSAEHKVPTAPITFGRARGLRRPALRTWRVPAASMLAISWLEQFTRIFFANRPSSQWNTSVVPDVSICRSESSRPYCFEARQIYCHSTILVLG